VPGVTPGVDERASLLVERGGGDTNHGQAAQPLLGLLTGTDKYDKVSETT
jgi:hypothetical protein